VDAVSNLKAAELAAGGLIVRCSKDTTAVMNSTAKS
jgi:hypothetical protein